MIIWFTGQPGSGKTTLADELYSRIDSGFKIDGDHLRKVFPGTGFSKEERYKNIIRAQEIAKFIESNGFNPIVSVVAPYRELRENFKSTSNILEIYVHTSEIRGREKFHVLEYEKPESNYIDVDTTNKTVESCIQQILDAIRDRV
jgi:adenylylsulfate kinase